MEDKKIKIVEDNNCPKCGKQFHCSSSSKCWCFEYEVPADKMEWIQENFKGCLCPECLREYSR